MTNNKLRYHHLGIPTKKSIEGEVYLKDYKCYQPIFPCYCLRHGCG